MSHRRSITAHVKCRFCISFLRPVVMSTWPRVRRQQHAYMYGAAAQRSTSILARYPRYFRDEYPAQSRRNIRRVHISGIYLCINYHAVWRLVRNGWKHLEFNFIPFKFHQKLGSISCTSAIELSSSLTYATKQVTLSPFTSLALSLSRKLTVIWSTLSLQTSELSHMLDLNWLASWHLSYYEFFSVLPAASLLENGSDVREPSFWSIFHCGQHCFTAAHWCTFISQVFCVAFDNK